MTTSSPCQGLPDRPCPWLRCDETVQNTTSDLFLCDGCERTRDKARHMKLGSVTIQNSPNISGNNSGATMPSSGRAKSASTMTNTKPTTGSKRRIVRTSSVSVSPITKNEAELTLIAEKSTNGANQMNNAEDQDENEIVWPQRMLTTRSTSSLKCDVYSLSFHSQCALTNKGNM